MSESSLASRLSTLSSFSRVFFCDDVCGEWLNCSPMWDSRFLMMIKIIFAHTHTHTQLICLIICNNYFLKCTILRSHMLNATFFNACLYLRLRFCCIHREKKICEKESQKSWTGLLAAQKKKCSSFWWWSIDTNIFSLSWVHNRKEMNDWFSRYVVHVEHSA